MSKLINVGFGNYVPTDAIISLNSPDSAPIKRKIDEARKGNKLIDATFGRRTRSVMFVKEDCIVLSAIQAETIAKRYADETVE